MRRHARVIIVVAALCFALRADAADPYRVGADAPKLITPQWIGEEGVEAVIILSIDDMSDPAPYEEFLRPILERLKQIDGRAAVSIMSCRPDPAHPQHQTWLREGLSLETHTIDHPCPLIDAGADGGAGGIQAAKSTFDRCVDLMFEVPGNRPVAFRTPCCDSQNSLDPRFFDEIFSRTTAAGRFVVIDSSVFNLPTDAGDRFRKYVRFGSYANMIEDYPYPYVIGGVCWEFPCAIPSDWQGQNLHGPNNPQTVEDWKAGLDACVSQRGVFTLVFHPHGWITSEQIVELIDHAVAKHGRKIKFLTFAEAEQRLTKNLLCGQALRSKDGSDSGVRLGDVNDDGFVDVLTGEQSRIWSRDSQSWQISRKQ